MSIDLNTCKAGQKLRRRDGEVVTYVRFDEHPRYPHVVTRDNGFETVYTTTGRYYVDCPCHNLDIVEISPIESETVKEIANIRAQLEQQTKKLAELEAKLQATYEKAKPWSPKHGAYNVVYSGAIWSDTRLLGADMIRQGRTFASEAAAQRASTFFTFYQRLVNLAAELNPSGIPGGDFRVVADKDHKFKPLNNGGTAHSSKFQNSPIALFETYEAAQKAAEIMNRDKWSVL